MACVLEQVFGTGLSEKDRLRCVWIGCCTAVFLKRVGISYNIRLQQSPANDSVAESASATLDRDGRSPWAELASFTVIHRCEAERTWPGLYVRRQASAG